MRIPTLLACCLSIALTLPAQAATFKIATIAPDGTTWMKKMKAGADEIKQKTEGRVKFRFYPGGVMGNDKSVLRKIRIGQLQGGAITGGGLMEVYPDAQVYNLPLAFNEYKEVDYVRQKMDKQLIKGLYDHDFVSFGLSEGGFAYLMSSTPIDTIDSISSHKVWVPEGDAISVAAFQSLDISPIPLPLTDVLTGLQTGLVDTVAASPIGAIALQWHTQVKYLMATPLMYLYGTLIVQKKAFERLSAADQKVVREVMTRTFAELDKINRNDNQKAREALKTQGIQFVEPTKEDKSDWQAAVKKSVTKLTQEGVVSKEIAEMLYGHLNDYRNSVHH